MTDEISSCHMCGRSTIARRFCSTAAERLATRAFPAPILITTAGWPLRSSLANLYMRRFVLGWKIARAGAKPWLSHRGPRR
jgi:hypothetical protein